MLASLNKKGEDFSCTSARGRNGWKEGAQMGSGGGKQKTIWIFMTDEAVAKR